MNRRRFVQLAVPIGIAGLALAQDAAKPDRLSGYVKGVDKSKMTIEMSMHRNQAVMRKIMCDANTKFTVDKKPATLDDVKENMRIVAIGKFEGVDLKATDVSANTRSGTP